VWVWHCHVEEALAALFLMNAFDPLIQPLQHLQVSL
jgi:hypothetical protein